MMLLYQLTFIFNNVGDDKFVLRMTQRNKVNEFQFFNDSSLKCVQLT